MAIAFVQAKSAVSQASGLSIGVTLDAAPASGNMLVGYVSHRSNSATPVWPSGWTVVWTALTISVSGLGTQEIAVKTSAGAGDQSTTVTFTPDSARGLTVVEYSGAVYSASDGDDWTSGSSGSYAIPSVTPTSAVERLSLVAVHYWDDPATLTWPSGWTQRSNGSTGGLAWLGHAFGDRVIASTSGAYSGTITSDRNTAWAVGHVMLSATFDPTTIAGGSADWEDDGFGLPASIDDLSPYIASWTITRGASAEITGGAQPGSARITLKNHEADRFNPLNTSSPLYGLLTDGVAVHLSVNSDGALTGEDPRGLFGGRIRSITPKPVPGATYAPFVELVCEDALGWYRRTPCRIADDLNRSHRDIRDAVLAEIGETRVDLARETRKVPLSGWDGDALSALEAINRANGTRHFIKPGDDADTWYAYTTRNRQWRLDATVDYTIDAGTDHVLSDGWTLTADTVINQQRATVTPVIFTQAAIEVWTAEDVPFSVKTGSPKVIWVEFDDYVDAPTLSVNRTGSTLTTAIESYGSTAKVTLTSAGTTTVTRIAINGRLARRLPSVSFVADDTTSQAGARGLRAGSDISGEFVGTISAAEGMAAHVVWRYGNPQFRPTLTITNWFPEMFEIDLFDTIAVTIDQLGMTARIFEVVGYQMDGYMAGTDAKLHVLRLVLQESRTQTDPGWFVLDTSELDDTDILGY